MDTTNRIKKFIAAKAEALPITDESGLPVGFADTKLFLTDGLRLAARISLANGQEAPIKKHVQTLYLRRGADDYAKAYITTIWEMQTQFFAPTLQHITNKGVEAWGLRGIRNGHVNQDLIDGFDNGPAPAKPMHQEPEG